MAAHSVRILEEVTGRAEGPLQLVSALAQFEHALDYAPGMDELDLDCWSRLNGLSQRLRRDIEQAFLEQRVSWDSLGKPESHEAWMRAKYPEADERVGQGR